MKASRLEIGQSGEARAKAYLESKGLMCLEQNFRCRGGEIDLVCKQGNRIVFVEVKVRKSADYGSGAEAVDFRKREKLLRTASYYLHMRHLDNALCRFDVISIEPGPPEKINHIENAFS